jgi:Ferritin-like domain
VEKYESMIKRPVNRRSLLKSGMLAGGAAVVGAGTGLFSGAKAFGQDSGGGLNKGDVAILRFLAAAELIESDLWTQYAELGGIGDNPPIELDPNQQLNSYQAALLNLDGDGPQYITSNTIDEISHATFLNGYLESKGADPVDFSEFETLQGSTATGAENIGRLTNLQHLNVDTSWFVRYRSATNPDFGATFPQAIKITNRTAIPITDADFNNPNHIQVIANTAAFHFGYIEQGGASLYQALGQKVSSREVLTITFGIGGDEVAHFLEWVDFAGNGVQAPVAPVSDQGLTFPDFFANPPLQPPSLVQPSLIFPVPCEFINPKLPHCAVIRPSSDRFGGAVATIASFTQDGLFFGQSKKFFQVVQQLAEEADSASRER